MSLVELVGGGSSPNGLQQKCELQETEEDSRGRDYSWGEGVSLDAALPSQSPEVLTRRTWTWQGVCIQAAPPSSPEKTFSIALPSPLRQR